MSFMKIGGDFEAISLLADNVNVNITLIFQERAEYLIATSRLVKLLFNYKPYRMM